MKMLALLACAGCSTSSAAMALQSSSPCDPLAAPPTAIGSILGVGQDTKGTIYVADEAPDGGGQDRVFVSSGTTLNRKHVAGSGGTGIPGKTSNADYTFTFGSPSGGVSDLEALLIQVRGGAVTAMALGPGDSKNFLGASDGGQTPLAVLDSGAIAGFTIHDLPFVFQTVVDVSSGNAVVITEPTDAYGTSDFRLFYGTPSSMIERPIVAYSQALSGPADISFTVGSATYVLRTTYVYDADSGPLGSPGPAMLDTGSGSPLAATLRLPIPTSLAGFSFTCAP